MEPITALNQYIKAKFVRLTDKEIDLISKFQDFSIADKQATASCVIDVLCLTLTGTPGNRHCHKQLHQMLENTPNPDVTRACYMAHLAGVDWGWRGLPPMVK